MQVTPKSSWGRVKALLHSVYDQPDADAVHAQFDRIVDALTDKLPTVAAHLEDARADILAFTALPEGPVAPDLVEQPERTVEPRDPPPHRRGRAFFPTGPRSSASSAPFSPNNTTNGAKDAATSASTSSPRADSTTAPTPQKVTP